MTKVAIVTDSNAGISEEDAKKLGVFVLPMPFTINGKDYFEGINLNHKQFFEMLDQGAEVFTSQPVVGDVSNLWDQVLQDYDEIVHIPMSSGLSGSCQTALMLASEYDGKVQVVDSQRISVTQKWDVIDAVTFAKQGKNAKEIKQILEDNKFDSSIYITVNTLEYLKKGGRITPAVALLGNMLKIKPILKIRGEKLDTFDKTRTMTKGVKIMMDAISDDIQHLIHIDGDKTKARVCVAYTKDRQSALDLKKQLEEIYPDNEIFCDELSLSVSCHIGPNSLAIAVCKKIV